MKINSINIDACIEVERFCKEEGIAFEVVPVDTDGETIYIYDLTIIDTCLSMLITEKDVCIYTMEHDVYINRDSFVSITII